MLIQSRLARGQVLQVAGHECGVEEGEGTPPSPMTIVPQLCLNCASIVPQLCPVIPVGCLFCSPPPLEFLNYFRAARCPVRLSAYGPV